MPGEPSDHRSEAARKKCQEDPSWNTAVELKRFNLESSEQWKQLLHERGNSIFMQEDTSQSGKDSKDSNSPGSRFYLPQTPQENWKRLGAAMGRARLPMRMAPISLVPAPIPVL